MRFYVCKHTNTYTYICEKRLYYLELSGNKSTFDYPCSSYIHRIQLPWRWYTNCLFELRDTFVFFQVLFILRKISLMFNHYTITDLVIYKIKEVRMLIPSLYISHLYYCNINYNS